MLFLGIDQHACQLTVSLRNSEGDVVLAPRRCKRSSTSLRSGRGTGTGSLYLVDETDYVREAIAGSKNRNRRF